MAKRSERRYGADAAFSTEDEEARAAAEAAEEAYLVEHRAVLDRIAEIQQHCAVLFADGSIARHAAHIGLGGVGSARRRN